MQEIPCEPVDENADGQLPLTCIKLKDNVQESEHRGGIVPQQVEPTAFIFSELKITSFTKA